MTHLEPIKARLADLATQANELRRELAACTLERASGDASAADRIATITAELRKNEDLQNAERSALDLAATFDRESATRERHKAAHAAIDSLTAKLEQRRKLAADLDKAALALGKSLRAFRDACDESHALAHTAATNALASLPFERRMERSHPLLNAVSVRDGTFLTACATMVARLFELETPEGAQLFRLVTDAMQHGFGHFTNSNQCSTFAQGADQTADQLSAVLVHLHNAMQAEAATLGAVPGKGRELLA